MELLFPFENIRSGQKQMIKDVNYVIKNEKHLIVHAPTGIGKTAAVLSGTSGFAPAR